MTDNAENSQNLTAEVETLRKLKTDLHKSLTEARARIKELEQSTASESDALAAAKAELLDIKLNKPVEALLDSVLACAKYSKQELAEHYQFELNDAGMIEMRDLEGSPIMITERIGGNDTTRQLKFDVQDVSRFLGNTDKFDHILRGSQHSGSGAGHGRSTITTKTTQPAKTSEFGLR